MNKLVIGAAVVLGTVFSALAEEDRAAQVYEMTVSVKTTDAKKGAVTPKKNPFVSVSDSIVYRKQSTQKWKGLVWGCDCESLAGKWRVIDETSSSVSGCVIWNSKSNDILFLDDLSWKLLNAIDVKGDKCEGAFTIGDMEEESSAFLTFAGFGSLVIKYTSEPCEDPELNCTSYVKTMSGNVAGWMPAPSLTTGGRKGTCVFCGEGDDGEEATTDASVAWDFCPCEEYADASLTAISGSWTLKYNAKLSAKLKNKASIVDVYKFPTAVGARVESKIVETLK